jgi:hypothetical protein
MVSSRPIIDAGPGLNFLSLNQARLLVSVVGALSAPETVEHEVIRKSRQDQRFRSAERAWRKLAAAKWLQILPDDPTPELEAVVRRITRLPMDQRLTQPKDLGETMVIAHAVVLAEAGETVTILIDDRGGARLAAAEVRRLDRLRVSRQDVGFIILVNTPIILKKAAGTPHIPDKAAMRRLYEQLRGLDDGLPPIDDSGLLNPRLWQSASTDDVGG